MSADPYALAVAMWWRGVSLTTIAFCLRCSVDDVRALLFARVKP